VLSKLAAAHWLVFPYGLAQSDADFVTFSIASQTLADALRTSARQGQIEQVFALSDLITTVLGGLAVLAISKVCGFFWAHRASIFAWFEQCAAALYSVLTSPVPLWFLLFVMFVA